MSGSSTNTEPNSVTWTPRLAAAFVMLSGSLALAGWAFDMAVLRRPFGPFDTSPAAALSFVLAGAGLMLLSDKGRHYKAAGIDRLDRERLKGDEARSLLASIVDSSGDAIVGKTLDGIVLSWNPGAEQMYGFSAAEMIGRSIALLAPPRRRGELQEILDRIRAGGTVQNYETEQIRKDCRAISVSLTISPMRDHDGRVVGASTVARDISDRLRSEQRFRGLLEAAPDAMVIVDEQDRIVLVNAQTERLFGYSREEVLGRPVETLVPTRFQHDHVKDGGGHLAEPRARAVAASLQLFALRKDGTQFPVEVSLSPLETGGERLLSSAIRDISERKYADDQIAALNEHLRRETERLEAANRELEAFSYSVSHDLRAPLRHIDGFADMLMKHADSMLDEKGRRYLESISSSVKSMGQLIDDLLEFSRMGRTQMHRREVDLNRLVDEVWRNVAQDATGRNISWHCAALPVVHGDPVMLRLAFTNLLSNAIKYTAPRDQARIEVGVLAAENREAGHEDVVFVRDNGVGFDMEYAGKLWGVFQRLHSEDEFEGTGIGLANVRRIILRHGGRTWAEGKVNGGATFYVSIPQASPPEQMEAA